MKNIRIHIITLLLLIFGCKESPSIMEIAEHHFIEEVQYMNKQDALSNEINYYKDPEITTSNHLRSLTGKELIQECNRVINEDSEQDVSQMGPVVFKVIRRVGDIKDYAMKNPDEIVAHEYYFSGTFTNYNNGYDIRSAKIIYIPSIDRYIVDKIYGGH